MSPAAPAMDLSRLYRNRVFASNRIDSSRAYLRDALVEHDVRCGAGAVDSALYSAGSPRLQMFVLRYGPEVEVRPQPFDGFALVQMPLSGSAEIESDGHRLSIARGQVAVIAPRRSVRLRWSRDCEQLLLRIPLTLVHEAAMRSTQGAAATGLQSALLLEGGASAQWFGLVQSLMELALPAAAEQPAACHPAWLEHVERSLAYFLLTQQPDGGRLPTDDAALGSHVAASSADAAAPLAPPLAAAEHYMQSRLCAPLSLEDLARAAGVSPRTLHMHCKRRFGVGPMVWLRHVRLEAARRMLESDADCLVTDAAMEFGFGHLGRFSAYYRERFGELPRQTAKR
ncbi:AraC family transcriptional regulator [Variovorax sp. ZT4R33]|uniref:AraC family transcriptional regulator n=1 Tax=Variovorax sp. ZT4R33 TaxID=3443743 RepID=UPI003F48E815